MNMYNPHHYACLQTLLRITQLVYLVIRFYFMYLKGEFTQIVEGGKRERREREKEKREILQSCITLFISQMRTITRTGPDKNPEPRNSSEAFTQVQVAKPLGYFHCFSGTLARSLQNDFALAYSYQVIIYLNSILIL